MDNMEDVMLRIFFVNCTLVSLLLLPFTARANLLSLDLNAFGDGLITFDTTTDLQWLDLSQTAGWATNNLVSEFGVGGAYEGWRYATVFEWQHLIQEGGLQPGVTAHNPSDPGLTYTAADLQAMLYLLGAPGYSGETINFVSQGSVGTTWNDYFGPGGPAYATWNLSPDLTFNGNGDFYVGSYDETWDPAVANPYGHYLVRTSVPEPASLTLFGLGLAGLGILRRRKASIR